MIKDIVNHTDPILREEMPAFDFANPIMDPVELYKDLAETMIDADGMGLSANQIGVRTRMFVMRAENVIGVINPRIIDVSSEMVTLEEGCLSYPNLFVKVKRPKFIKVRFTHPDGNTETKKFDGITARVFQHELDHLKGKLYIDYLDSLDQLIAVSGDEGGEGSEVDPESPEGKRAKRAARAAEAHSH